MTSVHNHRKVLLPVFLSIVLGLSFSAPSALAQDSQLEQLRDYLERNEELLHWAHDLVTETESQPARRVLQQANDLHQRSINLLEDGKPVLSFGVARRAREAIWSAVGQAREAMGLEERFRLRVERFRDMHGNLMDRARDLQNEEALDFLRRAEHQAIRAREVYLQGDLRLAMKLFENAEALTRRAARILADSASPEQIDREIERVANNIEQVRERLGDGADPAALRLLSEADEALDRSRESRDNGQPGRALQMVSLAGKLTRRAAKMGGLSADVEGLQRQLDHFDQRQQRIGDRVRESGSDGAQTMFQRALDLGARARSSANDQEVELGLRQIRAAHDMLNHTEDLLR
jgi:hypothetical protein